MTIKPFAIQGADLTLGGVNLSAGNERFVIPGVTQATDYYVEEVDDQDGNNPSVFGSNAGAVTVIDNADYVYRSSGTLPSGMYASAGYSVDQLDNGEIQEIRVENQGIFLAEDKTRAEAGNMWATTTPTPFASFNTANWTQIPFRPKMRAASVENIGGGGSGDSIDNGNYSVSVASTGVVTMDTSRGTVEFGALPEPGGPQHFHIMKGAGQDGSGGVDLYFGDDYNYVLQRADSYQGSPAYGVEIGANDRDGGDQHVWRFDPDGDLHIPPGKTIRDALTGDDLLAGAGGGNTVASSVWVQEFATSLGITDVPLLASSVEYLANGDIVALFMHTVNNDSSGYSGVARFNSAGTRVWSMNFTGALVTTGWGLAVDNIGGYIYVAGSALEDGAGEYEVATLTKLLAEDGSVEWSKQYDIGYANSNMVVDVASDGSPVVVGYADNGTDNQVVTTKIDPIDGSVTWSKALNGQGDEEAYGMAVGSNGEMVSVGWMDQYGITDAAATLYTDPVSNVNWTINQTGVLAGALGFDVSFAAGFATFANVSDTAGGRTVDGTVATILGSVLGGADGVDDMIVKVGTVSYEPDNRMLVVKYALSDGTIDWQAAVQVEEGYDCNGADADIDGGGNIYVCGNFEYNNSGASMIIFKLDTAGVKQWSRKVEGTCEDFATSIVVGPDGYLYLSAVTNTGSDFSMVIAKYDTNGNVIWQRLLDNTTSWTFAGGLFFGMNGGSNLAVKDGYVAVSGSFGDPGTTVPQAIVAQFESDGTEVMLEFYDFMAASFNGVLDNTASEITVTGAAKTDLDQSEAFTVTNFSPTVDLTSDLIGTRYSSPLGTTGTVKLTAPGNRKIEEVYGYNSVEVTSRFVDSTVTTTAAFANSGNQSYVPVNVSTPQFEELVALVNSSAFYYFEVSLDQNTWRRADYSGYSGAEPLTFTFGLSGGVTLFVNGGTTVYYRIVTGGDPVVWWNSADLPNGNNNFRGAVIDYHAYTGESTIIGTIHIVNDSGEEHITHTEVSSGSSDGANDDLWLVQNEGTVSYYRIDGESKTLKVQWTAKVFYGSEYYDD